MINVEEDLVSVILSITTDENFSKNSSKESLQNNKNLNISKVSGNPEKYSVTFSNKLSQSKRFQPQNLVACENYMCT